MITRIELHRQFKTETGEHVDFAEKDDYVEWLEETIMKHQNDEVEDKLTISKANELFCNEIRKDRDYE